MIVKRAGMMVRLLFYACNDRNYTRNDVGKVGHQVALLDTVSQRLCDNVIARCF